MTKRGFPRLRFSLGTLLLFVLLIGSGATLWSHWGPWTIEREIHFDGAPVQHVFSRDGKMLYALTHGKERRRLELTATDVTSWSRLWKASIADRPAFRHIMDGGVYISEHGAFLTVDISAEDRSSIQVSGVYNDHLPTILLRRDTGTRVEIPWEGEAEQTNGCLSIRTKIGRAFIYDRAEIPQANKRVLSFPDFAPLSEALTDLKISPSGELACRETASTLEFVTFPSCTPICALVKPAGTHPPGWKGDRWCMSDVVSLSRGTGTNEITEIFNPMTGKKIAEGYMRNANPELQMLYVMSNGFRTRGVPLNGGSEVDFGVGDIRDFSADNRLALAEHQNGNNWRTVDVKTGQTLHEDRDYAGALEVKWTPQFWNRYLAVPSSGHTLDAVRLYDPDTAALLFALDKTSIGLRAPRGFRVEYAPNSDRFATLAADTGEKSSRNMIEIWNRTRPWQWYGVAWLPAFWLTVVLCFAFIWSLLRDLRMP